MKKQITSTLAILGLLVILATAGVTSAQSTSRIVVNVPFEFYAGQKLMPAGEYTVTRLTHSSQAGLLVRSADGHDSAIVLTNQVQAKGTPAETRLSFNRYGDDYFLAQVWARGSGEGREVQKSERERRLERELLKSNSADDVAAARTQRQTVSVAGRVQ